MSEVKPTPENLSDPYVLQLILALSKQHERIKELESWILELNDMLDVAQREAKHE